MDRSAMFPEQLTDPRVFEIARALLDGFDRHYKIFGLRAEHFEDPLHLDPDTGGQIYSRHIATELATLLAAPEEVR